MVQSGNAAKALQPIALYLKKEFKRRPAVVIDNKIPIKLFGFVSALRSLYLEFVINFLRVFCFYRLV
jgi:hypothetical protein